MKQSWIIAMREFRERVLNRSFLMMLLIGPLMVLTLAYFLVKANDEGKKELNVLIADPGNIMDGVISSKESKSVNYYFIDGYLELGDFKKGKDYQKYDVLVEVNEKVLNNKKVFVFYRDFLSADIKNVMKFNVERRVEEVMVKEFTDLTVDRFRQIKQPLNMDFRNIDDPTGIESNTEPAAASNTHPCTCLRHLGDMASLCILCICSVAYVISASVCCLVHPGVHSAEYVLLSKSFQQ